VFIRSSMCVTYPAFIIIFDSAILIFGE
jgi:hypothetical protein